uniref:DUF1015 domain-containing protein n=1 Tax=Ammonifex degensii TaxID=42838 RepID=A0A7C2IZM9_9THEO
MAEITPIRGYRYSTRIPDPAAVIAPPYDVIDQPAQQLFYARHPYNIIRLEYGAALPEDSATNNRYTRAAELFKQWRKEGVLVEENQPALYLYEQTFTVDGRRRTRRGFFCGLKLEPYGANILPHEETLPAAKADRLALLSACRAQFSPIFGLYSDPAQRLNRLLTSICRDEPVYAFTDDEQQAHRLWVVTDTETITTVKTFLANQRVFIADGHHRYETALKYRAQRRAAGAPSGIAPYDWTLTLLVNIYDPGLVILPTHRLVKTPPDFALADFLAAAGSLFTIQKAEKRRLLSPSGKYAFGLHTRNEGFILTLKKGLDPAEIIGADKPPVWKRLAVNVLHALLLEKHLGISESECAAENRIGYTHSPAEALALVKNGTWDLAFFIGPPEITEVIAVAEAGEKMPQKSTYFYPKVPTGLVIYSLDAHAANAAPAGG